MFDGELGNFHALRYDRFMTKGTQATSFLTRQNVPFTLHPYDYDPAASGSIGIAAARAIGQAPEHVFKTLMAEVDGKPACVVVPVAREVSMKKLAAAFSGKSARMMKPADAERITGFRVGGISPFGQRKVVPTVFSQEAAEFPLIFINAGARGLLLSLDPQAALRVTGARLADLLGA